MAMKLVLMAGILSGAWLLGAMPGPAGGSQTLDRYDVFEIVLQGSWYSNPYTDAPQSEVTFTDPDGRSFDYPMFWNGGTQWIARIAPGVAGSWSWSVSSADPQLDGQQGTFSVDSQIGGLNGHGLVEVDPEHPHKFRYSDGTPFFFMGHSIDWHCQGNWSGGQYEQIVQARSQQGFTVLVDYAGPGIGKIAFEAYDNEGGKPFFDNSNLDQLNPAHFQEVDERLEMAVDNGLACTVALSFADQGIWNMNKTKLERCWAYVMARYAAYPIFWQPIGEYNEGSVSRAVEIGEITDAFDIFNHPLSMHPTTSSAPLAGYPWFDWIIHQSDGSVSRIRDEYPLGKPIVEEEHRDENPDHVREAVWRHFANGAYYTLTMANYVIDDTRTDYMDYFADFAETTGFQSLEPHLELVGSGDCIANPGWEYVVYSTDGPSLNLDLTAAAGKTLDCRFYNPRTGQFGSTFQRPGGGIEWFTKPDSNDWALHVAAAPEQAANPNPPDQAACVSVTTPLSWVASEGAITYNVYFGETPSPPFQASQRRTTFGVADLDTCRTYYWRIDAANAYRTTPGEVWSFTTVSVPGDFDCDGDVDQKDFGHLQVCLSGSGEPQTDPNCRDAILDGDEDVDQNDLAVFRGCMSGANVAPEPDCAN